MTSETITGVKTSDETAASALTGAELVRIVQSGESRRTTAGNIAKINRSVWVEDFGAVGNGVTDDSAAFTAAIASGLAVQCDGGAAYVIGDITLSNAQTIDFNGARIIGKSGAACLVKLTGFRAVVQNFNVTDATALSEAAFVFDNGRFCVLQDGRIQNATTAIKLKATVAATGCIKPSILNVNVETFSAVGIDLGPNVLQLNATDVFLDSGGTHGVRHISTGSVIAYGGHTYNNVRCEGCGTGWLLTDATLTEIIGGWADTCSGIGFRVTGNSDHINVNDFFIGTCTGGAVSVENTARVNIAGLQTFANSDTISVLNTARLTMDASQWKGAKPAPTVASGASFNLISPMFTAGSTAPLAVSTTTFLGTNANNTTEGNTVWRAPYDCNIIGLYATCSTTPVTTHVFTLRTDGVDRSMVATITAGNFAARAWGSQFVTAGTPIAVKVLPGTTTTSNMTVNVQFVPAY